MRGVYPSGFRLIDTGFELFTSLIIINVRYWIHQCGLGGHHLHTKGCLGAILKMVEICLAIAVGERVTLLGHAFDWFASHSVFLGTSSFGLI